jgi:hypothetical protein
MNKPSAFLRSTFYLSALLTFFSSTLLPISVAFAQTDLTLPPPDSSDEKRPAVIQVVPGDTLSDIAQNRYQNWIKWKDIWKLNTDRIKNPHWIYPGQKLRMLDGEEVMVGSVNGQTSMSSTSASGRKYRSHSMDDEGGNSNEWRLLPHQSWEDFVFELSPNVDPNGFDRRSKSVVHVYNKTTPSEIISSDRLAIHGEITNARTDFTRVFLGEQVFIKADEQLQVGTTYAVTSGPEKVKSTRDGRVGFVYDIGGKVKIVGVRDGVFIGTVTKILKSVERHNLLIPDVQFFAFPNPVAAASPVTATIVVPYAERNDQIVQEKIVFLDVGKDDGVKNGMIFRNYLHRDPLTHEELSTKDFLIQAELQVIDVQDKFSSAIVVREQETIPANSEVVALTDLSDYGKSKGMQSLIQDAGPPATIDDLDRLDNSQGLGSQEDKDLRQLEKWNKPTFGNGGSSSDSGSGTEDIQKMNAHPATATVGIGDEVAPNDGSTVHSTPATAGGESIEKIVPTTTPPAMTPPATTTPIETPPSSEMAPPSVTPPVSTAPANGGLDAVTPAKIESSSDAPTAAPSVQEKSTLQSAESAAQGAEKTAPPPSDPFGAPSAPAAAAPQTSVQATTAPSVSTGDAGSGATSSPSTGAPVQPVPAPNVQPVDPLLDAAPPSSP